MNNNIISRLLLTLLFVSCPFTFCAAQKQITILHTNDTHSTVMPLNKNLADTMLADRGGYLRRIALLKEERQKDPDLLLFDSGDFSQGSAYYSMFQGDVEIGLMNQMGYDAATIGN
ncbi:MAG: metallophosphoesterase, partial [Prevotella sp.]